MANKEINIPLSKFEGTMTEISRLREQLNNINFLRYLIVVKNTIEMLDELVWKTNPPFQYLKEDLDYDMDFHNQQKEKRRLRLLHLLGNNNEKIIVKIRDKLCSNAISSEEFADRIAEAHGLISKDIHDLSSHNVVLQGKSCESITSEKDVNKCLNILINEVKLDIGQITVKRKLNTDENIVAK